MQLGRPVRRAHDERHPGVVRLDDGRVQFCGGRAARHADDGRPPRRHRQPQARRNAPLRSSRRTWTRSRSAKGSARGVERDPAQTTASVTPRRTHSSTRVALKVACTLTRRAPPCRRARVRAAAGRAARLHPDRTPLGPLRGTPGRVAHAGRGGSAGTRRFGVGAGRPADDSRSGGGGGAGRGRRRGMRPARLLARCAGGLHVALGADLALRGVVFIGVTAGIEDPGERERRRQSDDRRWPTTWRPRATSSSFIDAWLRGPLFERLDVE